MPARLFRLALAPIGFFLLVLPLSAQDRPPPARTISLLGTGEVLAKPDIAIITIGVTKRADTASGALAQNNAAMTAIVEQLKQAGVQPKDIQTSNFTVGPAYIYDNQNQQPPKIIGYDVSNQVTVTLRKLEEVGTILDQVVAKGSNQIFGIGFSLADPQPLEDQARRLAVADAMRKAKLYAETAGISLGPIVSILEHVQPPPGPVFMKAQRMEAADGAVPVAEGEQAVSAQVNISWEIR